MSHSQRVTHRAVAALGLLAAVLCWGPGCGSSSKRKEPAWTQSPFAGLDPKPIRVRWSGSWVMPFRTQRSGDSGKPSTLGNHEIWTIQGERFERYDGQGTETGRLTLLAPCVAMIHTPHKRPRGPFGSSRLQYRLFYFDGPRLYVGRSGGFVKGDLTVACFDTVPPTVVTRRGKTCWRWERGIISHGNSMDRKAARCQDVQEGGRVFFTVASKGGESRWTGRLERKGNLLVDPIRTPSAAKRYDSFQIALKSLKRKLSH